MPSDRLVFFLGGHDLEMVTIRDLLVAEAHARVHDKGLGWGAKASAYAAEIEEALARGCLPVLVELEDDLNLEGSTKAVVIDHHGARAGKDKPTSLHQVFDVLHLPQSRWTRWFDLVAANDRGYIPALMEIGASRDEVISIRAADRAAQGITAEQEAQGERAVATAQVLADGRLTLVSLPHDRTAAVADRLELALGGPGFENLFILGSDTVNVFGDGGLILALSREFPTGWFGGALPDRGFWGHSAPQPSALAFVLNHLRSR